MRGPKTTIAIVRTSLERAGAGAGAGVDVGEESRPRRQARAAAADLRRSGCGYATEGTPMW